jgi:hypothetical protein
VFLEQFGDFPGGFLAGPVTLQFADVGPGRYRIAPAWVMRWTAMS